MTVTRTPAQSVEAFEQAQLAAKRRERPRRWWQPLTEMLDSILADVSRDGRTRYEWHRGSLRRYPPKVKGKAAVKAAKRARQQARRTFTS